MKKRVAVVTEDIFLFQKIYLILKPYALVERAAGDDYGDGDADLCLWDIDTTPLEADIGDVTLVGRDCQGLKVPFSDDELLMLVLARQGGAMLRLGERCAYLRSRRIRLTEVEFALLSLLVQAGGEYVLRDELLYAVWGRDAEASVLNVYVHYLREKLECEGEKIIISSRNMGYKIDEKYLREVAEC